MIHVNKRFLPFVIILMLLFSLGPCRAQFLKDLKKKIDDKVSTKLEEKADEILGNKNESESRKLGEESSVASGNQVPISNDALGVNGNSVVYDDSDFEIYEKK